MTPFVSYDDYNETYKYIQNFTIEAIKLIVILHGTEVNKR